MIKICANCFQDEELKRYISTSSSKETGICACCGAQSELIDLKEILDFFIELLSLFTIDEDGKNIIQVIQDDWNIFYSDACAKKILAVVLQNTKNSTISLINKVSYIAEIKEISQIWNKLKKEVKEDTRYFANLNDFDWSNYLEPNTEIKKGTFLFRARIIPEGKSYLSRKDMGTPPKEKASSGRANPLGIPYLYLCDNIDTTYYEIRAVYLDRVAIGNFKVNRDLQIVDFNSRINLFYSFLSDSNKSMIEVVKHNLLINEISKDLSRPLRRFDTELEYIPTQLICEYCKLNNADGIRFKSSLHQKGMNIVLFNSQDARCTKVSKTIVSNVVIECRNSLHL